MPKSIWELDIGEENNRNTCIDCGVIIDDGLVHCNNCRNKYRT
jgi:hypothetical protein